MAKALALPGTVREWTQGVDLKDAGAAAGGLALTISLPGMLVKDTSTGWRKTLKVAASFGTAMGAGALGKAVLGSSAGKAAVIGGIAGATAQVLAMFIPNFPQIGRPIGRVPRRIGETVLNPGPTERGGEQTGVIIP